MDDLLYVYDFLANLHGPSHSYPLGMTNSLLLKMTMEIVNVSIKDGDRLC